MAFLKKESKLVEELSVLKDTLTERDDTQHDDQKRAYHWLQAGTATIRTTLRRHET